MLTNYINQKSSNTNFKTEFEEIYNEFNNSSTKTFSYNNNFMNKFHDFVNKKTCEYGLPLLEEKKIQETSDFVKSMNIFIKNNSNKKQISNYKFIMIYLIDVLFDPNKVTFYLNYFPSLSYVFNLLKHLPHFKNNDLFMGIFYSDIMVSPRNEEFTTFQLIVNKETGLQTVPAISEYSVQNLIEPFVEKLKLIKHQILNPFTQACWVFIKSFDKFYKKIKSIEDYYYLNSKDQITIDVLNKVIFDSILKNNWNVVSYIINPFKKNGDIVEIYMNSVAGAKDKNKEEVEIEIKNHLKTNLPFLINIMFDHIYNYLNIDYTTKNKYLYGDYNDTLNIEKLFINKAEYAGNTETASTLYSLLMNDDYNNQSQETDIRFLLMAAFVRHMHSSIYQPLIEEFNNIGKTYNDNITNIYKIVNKYKNVNKIKFGNLISCFPKFSSMLNDFEEPVATASYIEESIKYKQTIKEAVANLLRERQTFKQFGDTDNIKKVDEMIAQAKIYYKTLDLNIVQYQNDPEYRKNNRQIVHDAISAKIEKPKTKKPVHFIMTPILMLLKKKNESITVLSKAFLNFKLDKFLKTMLYKYCYFSDSFNGLFIKKNNTDDMKKITDSIKKQINEFINEDKNSNIIIFWNTVLYYFVSRDNTEIKKYKIYDSSLSDVANIYNLYFTFNTINGGVNEQESIVLKEIYNHEGKNTAQLETLINEFSTNTCKSSKFYKLISAIKKRYETTNFEKADVEKIYQNIYKKIKFNNIISNTYEYKKKIMETGSEEEKNTVFKTIKTIISTISNTFAMVSVSKNDIINGIKDGAEITKSIYKTYYDYKEWGKSLSTSVLSSKETKETTTNNKLASSEENKKK